MVDHAALVPSFRDFSSYRQLLAGAPPELKLRKPTVLEVERALQESPAGKLGQAISTEGWPWLERMEFLSSVIPGIRFHSLGGMAPFQADGIWGPYEWYYRERGGGASLGLAPIATFPSASDSLYRATDSAPDFAGSTGWLSRFLKLWESLSRAPFIYEFSALELEVDPNSDELNFVPTGEIVDQPGWGHSVEEAREQAAAYSPYLDEKLGWSRETQARRRELMELSEEPVNSDERVYPLEDPDFTVNWEALELPEELQHFVAAPVSADS